jgi:hypothetical protein
VLSHPCDKKSAAADREDGAPSLVRNQECATRQENYEYPAEEIAMALAGLLAVG